MADKQDESNMRNGAAEGGCCSGTELHDVVELTIGEDLVMSAEDKNGRESHCVDLSVKDEAVTSGISEYLQSSTEEGNEVEKDCQVITQYTGDGLLHEQNIVTSFVETTGIETDATAEYSTVTSEFVNTLSPATTTIIYVQPDGSFVEGTGLTAEEQQQLVEQLAKQQLVQVTENEAARLFEQQQEQPPPPPPPPPQPQPARYMHAAALAPNELQQVINQVSKSQKAITQVEQQSVVPAAQRQQLVRAVPEQQQPACFSLEPGCVLAAGSQVNMTVHPQPLTIMQNASQQLQNVAKQVALQQSQSQNGTRLIQKKMETIQIQVQLPPVQEAKERPMPPLAILQPKNLSVNQQPGKVNMPTGVSVTCPQIIHIAPVVGEQQYLVHNSGDPPIQLLLQRSSPVVGGLVPVLHKVPIQTPLNGKEARSTGDPTRLISTSNAEKKERQKEKNRPKRPQKIKTRSGRVSRPPKYKVKDYKFIKREDLADSHQSDSDDYSEISVEEEEREEGRNSTSVMNFNLNPKAFKCETCEKAYIGNGGLTRHYRLNPTHRDQRRSTQEETSVPLEQQGIGPSPNSAAALPETVPGKDTDPPITPVAVTEDSAVTSTAPMSPAEVVAMTTSAPAALPHQEGQKAELPNVQIASVGLEPGQPRGPGRPKGPGRPGRPKVAARPTRRGRPGRPPKHLGGLSVEQQTQRRKARLKEVLQQCNNEELMEMALPRLAKVMTVWEFLLMKVEKGRPSRPQFSDVYREFEQLHGQVKKMAQDHFSSHSRLGSYTTLEVHDPQVSLSLGIKDLVNTPKAPGSEQVHQKVQAVCQGKGLLTKNTCRTEDCRTLPPAKRFKLEKAAVETSSFYLSQNGTQKVVGEEHSPSGPPKQDTVLAVSEVQPKVPALDLKEFEMEITPKDNHLETSGVEPSDKLTVLESGKSHLSEAEPQPDQVFHSQMETVASEPQVVITAMETDLTAEDLVQEQLSNSTETVDPVGEMDKEAIETHPLLLEVSHESQSAPEMESCETLNESDIADQMDQLEQALSTDAVPLDHSYRTSAEEPQQPTETVNELEQNCGLGNAISLGGTVGFQLAEASQKEDHEQIFIQAEDGLIMHHTGGSSERIVIVTSPDGTTMHIRAPEEVPLEAVQALLGIETEGQTEGILIQETQH